MPRGTNPYYSSPYPTDPAGAIIGANLGRALFGDPEMARAAALARAQAENYGAQAEEARAHAGLYGSQKTGVDIQNGALEAGHLSDIYHDPRIIQSIQARGGGAGGMNADDIAKGEAAFRMYDAATGEPGVLPPTEDQSRLLGAILGHAPVENTAYTTAYGDKHQKADNDTKLSMENIQSADRRYGTDRGYAASIYNTNVDASTAKRGQDIGAATSRRGQDMESTDRRYKDDKDAKAPKFSPSQLGNMDAEINAQVSKLPPDLQTKVRVRAVELTQQTGNPAGAVQQAVHEMVGTRQGSGLLGTGLFGGTEHFDKTQPQSHKKPLSAYGGQ